MVTLVRLAYLPRRNITLNAPLAIIAIAIAIPVVISINTTLSMVKSSYFLLVLVSG